VAPGHALIIFFAGMIAGMVNSVAGGGTLISFPVLVWLGRNPILANATNTVALWPGSFAAALGFRRYLEGSGPWIVMLGIPSLVGGILGAVLLLRTPTQVFAWLVPYLILSATLLLAAQEPVTRRFRSQAPKPTRSWWTGAILFQLMVAIYGGYFGAGIGILMLAALGLLRMTDIYQMNALKNLFATGINGIAAVYFAFSGAVIWSDGAVMALGAVAGGFGGASLARRAGSRIVRGVAVAVGFGMAVSLLLRNYGIGF
jgi:uncharacterized protein